MVKRKSFYINLLLYFQRFCFFVKSFQQAAFLTTVSLTFLLSINPVSSAGADNSFTDFFESNGIYECIPPLDKSDCPSETEEISHELTELYDSKADNAYMEAGDLLKRCEFKPAINQTVEAANIMKKYCEEAGAEYRKQEKQVRCYTAKHGEYNEQSGAYDLDTDIPQAFNYDQMKKALEDNAQIIAVNLEMFDKIEAREKNIYRRFWEFIEIQDDYKKKLSDAERALIDKNMAGICAPIAALQSELNRLSGTCRDMLLVEVDVKLKNPEDIISDLDQIAASQLESLQSRLNEADQAVAECEPDKVKAIIENMNTELDSLVSYQNGKCINIAPEEARQNILKISAWLQDTETNRREAEELLSRAETQALNVCSYKTALSDHGSEEAIREKAGPGCITDIDERLDAITNSMIDQSAMAKEQEDILSGILFQISDAVDMNAAPPKCDADKALKLINEYESAAVQCSADNAGIPTGKAIDGQVGIRALQNNILGKKNETALLAKSIETDLNALNTVVAAVESEKDCTAAENLLKEQEMMTEYISGCPQYADKIKESLQSIKNKVDQLKGPGSAACEKPPVRVRLPDNFFKITWKEGRDWLISRGMKVVMQEVVDESAEGGCINRDAMGPASEIYANSWNPADRSLQAGDDVTLQFCSKLLDRVHLTEDLFKMTWEECRDWLVSKGMNVTLQEKEACIDHENREGLVNQIKAESWDPRKGSIKVGDAVTLVYCGIINNDRQKVTPPD